MKAVVLELKGDKAAVLKSDGAFCVVKNKGYRVGERIVLREKKRGGVIGIAFKAACAAAAIAVCSLGVYAYVTPYSYVSLDVNPSIEYVLNRFDRVLSINAVNDDGGDIVRRLESRGVCNRPISRALEMTVDELCQSDYISENEENVVIVAASSNTEQKALRLASSLESSVSADTGGERGKTVVECMAVTPERVRQARQLGVTPGKLNVVEQLEAEESDTDDFSKEEWLQKPVKEVVEAIRSRRMGGQSNGGGAGDGEKAVGIAPKQGNSGHDNGEQGGQGTAASDEEAQRGQGSGWQRKADLGEFAQGGGHEVYDNGAQGERPASEREQGRFSSRVTDSGAGSYNTGSQSREKQENSGATGQTGGSLHNDATADGRPRSNGGRKSADELNALLEANENISRPQKKAE